MRFTALFAAAALLIVPAPAQSRGSRASIIVKHRFTGLVCAGLCVNEVWTVYPEGVVTYGTEGDEHKERMISPAKLQVGREAASGFLREMNSLLQIRKLTKPSECKGPSRVSNIWDWDIVFPAISADKRILTCNNGRAVLGAWRRALVALGMPGGIAGGWNHNVKLLDPARLAPTKADGS
jgi:hypothetical protein